MHKTKLAVASFVTTVLLMCGSPSLCYASDNDLSVFGFFQGNMWKYDSDPSPVTPSTVTLRTASFGIGQANVFLSKSTDYGLSGFVNLEFVNNYSSDKGWGSFNLQEAFIRYEQSEKLVLKGGLFVPTFNNLYEVYNRTPLLPYLFRPMLYETQQGQVTRIFDILPSRAFAQVSGFQAFDEWKIDYAAHFGNASGFIESPGNVLQPDYVGYGQNATEFMSFGGRVGLRYKTLKLGASAVVDKHNKREFAIDLESTQLAHFGDLNRIRLGADLSLSLAGFTLTAEYFQAKTALSSNQLDSLALWAAIPNSQVGTNFDATSYFATLLYDIDDEWFVYTMYDHFADNGRPYYVGIDGYTGVSAGGGYRASESLVLKAQFRNDKGTFLSNDNNGLPIKSTTSDKYYLAGFSYSF